MSEEKNRNMKTSSGQTGSTDNIPSFLLKTYEILENNKYSDIIAWTKSGQGFVVKKVKEFAENILPIHFRHSNYTSFVRQLNMYDFHKTRQENQENAFKNSMFKRGQRHLLKEIERKDYKKKKDKQEANQKTDTVIIENQIKNIKKTEIQKQFYLKGLNTLFKIDEEMNKKQSQLADLDGKYFDQTDQAISQVLEMIFSVRSYNNNWNNKLVTLGKQWSGVLNTKKMALRNEIQNDGSYEYKKQQQPTMPSLHSFSHHF